MDDEVNQVCRMPSAEELMCRAPEAPNRSVPPPPVAPETVMCMPRGADGTHPRAAVPFDDMFNHGPSISSLSPEDARRDREYTNELRERQRIAREMTGVVDPSEPPDRQNELWRDMHRHPIQHPHFGR